MRGELSNGGLHVVLPQELCKGVTREAGNRRARKGIGGEEGPAVVEGRR